MRKMVSMPRIRSFPQVGFWYSEDEPDLPRPRDFVDREWDREERAWVLAYLDQTYSTDYICMGVSSCRFCGQQNGSLDLTDGTFLFPEGFAHYVRDHSVRPPEEFLQHLRDLHYQVPELTDFKFSISGMVLREILEKWFGAKGGR